MKQLMENWRKLLAEWDEDDTEHFDDLKSDNDYTAAGNFKMGDVVKVMNRGTKHDEPEELRCRVGTVTGMDGTDLTLKFENGEEATIGYYNAARDEYDLWNNKNLYGDCAGQVNEDCWDGYERVPGSKEGAPGSCRKKTNEVEEDEKELEEGEGLWKNIHAKRKRMKAGSGEKKAKPGDEDYPETLDVDEAKNPYTKEAQVADILAGLFEGCGEPAPVDYDHGPEASMHRSSLHTIKGEVEQLLYMIGEQDDLPEWLEAKITKARAYLSAAKDYLSGEQAEMAGALEERLAGTIQLGEKPAKGKKSSKTYTNPDTGRKNKVSYGQKGAKISPGTSKGDSYCARSFGIKKGLPKDKQNDPNTPNNLSRKKWKCKGKKSTKE